MLRIDQLSKRYGDHLVFQGLTQTFSAGCVSLCEEDSTGKSTLLGMIAGAVPIESGDVFIDGHSITRTPQQAKARLAYIPDDCLAFPEQTGRGLLTQVASAKSITLDDNALDLANRLGLASHLDKRFDQMSTGTRRKVFLAAAAFGEPAVIVADGPTSGLDTAAKTVLIEQFILWSRDRVVLFASHDAAFVHACNAKTINVAELK